jgi:hypothetical protein
MPSRSPIVCHDLTRSLTAVVFSKSTDSEKRLAEPGSRSKIDRKTRE